MFFRTLLILSLSLPNHAEAGAWVREAGSFYAKGSFLRFTSRQFVDSNNQVVPLEDARFEGDLVGAYGEIGLGHGLGIVAHVPYAASRNVHLDPRVVYAYRWLGDVELGLVAGRRLRGLPLSLSVIAKLPAYDNHDPRIALGQEQAFPILGDGQIDVTAWLATGGGAPLSTWRTWFQVEVGYRLRTHIALFDSDPDQYNYVDGIPWHVQGGLIPVFQSKERGWWLVELWGLNNLRKDGRTKQFLQVSTALAPRLWGHPHADSDRTSVVHLELSGAWIPVARNSATGWSAGIGLSLGR